jgi:hypothetical protein
MTDKKLKQGQVSVSREFELLNPNSGTSHSWKGKVVTANKEYQSAKWYFLCELSKGGGQLELRVVNYQQVRVEPVATSDGGLVKKRNKTETKILAKCCKKTVEVVTRKKYNFGNKHFDIHELKRKIVGKGRALLANSKKRVGPTIGLTVLLPILNLENKGTSKCYNKSDDNVTWGCYEFWCDQFPNCKLEDKFIDKGGYCHIRLQYN